LRSQNIIPVELSRALIWILKWVFPEVRVKIFFQRGSLAYETKVYSHIER